MSTFPLTPAQALAVAAMIETHPNPLPHWAWWAKALQTWAAAEFEASQPVEEPEVLAASDPVWPSLGLQGFEVSQAIADEYSAAIAAVEASKDAAARDARGRVR